MDYKQEFITIAGRDIQRAGFVDLMVWINGTDFFTAPASTRFHGNYAGGLVEHSLNVHSHLQKLCKFYNAQYTDESIAIVSLFHDLCKINTYKTEMRWRKNSHNQWEQYPVYVKSEDFAYGGHGSKSVFLIQSFMALTPDEASAINCHMGQFDATTYSNPTPVYERNMLAWLLHVADEAATYITEPKEVE